MLYNVPAPARRPPPACNYKPARFRTQALELWGEVKIGEGKGKLSEEGGSTPTFPFPLPKPHPFPFKYFCPYRIPAAGFPGRQEEAPPKRVRLRGALFIGEYYPLNIFNFISYGFLKEIILSQHLRFIERHCCVTRRTAFAGEGSFSGVFHAR